MSNDDQCRHQNVEVQDLGVLKGAVCRDCGAWQIAAPED